ncbi:hypothetical protein N9H39_11385 [Gammaproteobacteria bacterium]|nr:hypothetical protein [Gammaproteobacteria bacterium]
MRVSDLARWIIVGVGLAMSPHVAVGDQAAEVLAGKILRHVIH